MNESEVRATTARRIAYWALTALTASVMLWSGWLDLSGAPDVIEGMARLGYPPYLREILGVWKVLAAVAILAPKAPLLKEWAYAGILFDLTGASLSHAASGDGAVMVVTPLLILCVAMASWALRPADRKNWGASAPPSSLTSRASGTSLREQRSFASRSHAHEAPAGAHDHGSS